jgi:hypothetical protein
MIFHNNISHTKTRTPAANYIISYDTFSAIFFQETKIKEIVYVTMNIIFSSMRMVWYMCCVCKLSQRIRLRVKLLRRDKWNIDLKHCRLIDLIKNLFSKKKREKFFLKLLSFVFLQIFCCCFLIINVLVKTFICQNDMIYRQLCLFIF